MFNLWNDSSLPVVGGEWRPMFLVHHPGCLGIIVIGGVVLGLGGAVSQFFPIIVLGGILGPIVYFLWDHIIACTLIYIALVVIWKIIPDKREQA